MQGINLLKKHDVQWNAMAVVNDYNADYPLDFYHFFKELDCHYIQFAPIVERIFDMPTDVNWLHLPNRKKESSLISQSLRNNGETFFVLCLTNG